MPDSKSRPTHVAFLRGINVGANNPIKMADLVKVVESLKCRDIKTILASGNILFSQPAGNKAISSATFEAAIAKSCKKQVGVIVLPLKDIHALVESTPFKEFSESKTTRLHTTFMSADPKLKLKLPYKSEKGDLTIVAINKIAVCWIAHLVPGRHSGMCMATLEKMIGKDVTTRSWNTVQKIAAFSEGS